MRLSFARVEEAARTIDPVFLDSPQYVCEPLADALGVDLTLKVEALNPVRCFKGRGASYCVAGLAGDGPLVCASAGNFWQAMADACRTRGRAAIVFAGEPANPLKIARMRAMVGRRGGSRRRRGCDLRRTGSTRRRRKGQERLSGVSLDAVPVPLGNGALLAGVALALRTLAAGAPAMTESLRSGEPVSYPEMRTMADGIGVRIPIPEALEDLRGLVDETLLVEERGIVTAMRLIHRHAGIVVEPSGAVGVAAILCGGNLTPEQMRDWLNQRVTFAGRGEWL